MIKKNYIKAVLLTVLSFSGLAFIILSFRYTPMISKHADSRKYGGIYRYAHSENLSTLDPRKAIFSVALNSMFLVFDPLIKVSNDMKLVPSICASWEMANNNFTFICHIRRGILFHNGTELTSKDVLFSLNYLARKGDLDLDTSSLSAVKGVQDYWNGKTQSISGIKEVDNYTISIDLNRSCQHFVYIISSQRYIVIPTGFNGENRGSFFSHPIGTGPFKFASLKDNNLYVTANESYFNGRPYLDGLKLVYYSTKDDALQAFINNEIDDLTHYRIAELPQEIRDGNYSLQDSYFNLIVFPNNSRKPFNNENMRKLLFSAIDHHNVVEKCFPTSEASETIIPRGIIGFYEDAPRIQYDKEYAVKLLQKMKRNGVNLPKVTIYTTQVDVNDCTLNAINDSFTTLGLPWHLEFTTSDNLAKYFFDGSMDAELEQIGVANEDAYNILRFFDSNNSENLARIRDSKIDSSLKEVIHEPDLLKRMVTCRDIDARIIAKNYAMPIVSPKIYSIRNMKFKLDQNSTTKTIQDFTQISLSGDKI